MAFPFVALGFVLVGGEGEDAEAWKAGEVTDNEDDDESFRALGEG